MRSAWETTKGDDPQRVVNDIESVEVLFSFRSSGRMLVF